MPLEGVNVEYIASTLFGGGCVWGATKIHIHYILKKIAAVDNSIKLCDRRLHRLETLQMQDRRVK